jgi:hypothetical protein
VLAGESPYSRAVTEHIQIAMYGYVRGPDVDQNSFAHPAYSALVLLPVAVLDAPLATALWMTFQLLAVAISLVLWLDLLRWRPHPLVFGLILFGCLIGLRHPVNIFLLGQFPGSILLGFSTAVWLLQRQRDAAAGVALVLCTVPPTMGGSMALALAGTMLVAGRWKVAAVFVSVMAVLTGITLLRIGFWIPDWLDMLNQYSHYANPVWPPGLLQTPLLELLLVAAVVGMLASAIIRYVRAPGPQELVNLALHITLGGLLLLPTTGTYYLVLIIPALLATFARGSLVAVGAATATIAVTWVILIATQGTGSKLETLIVPLMAWVSWQLALRFPRRAVRQDIDKHRIPDSRHLLDALER